MRGNLAIVTYEEEDRELEVVDGVRLLPLICEWRIPVTFVIHGLEDVQYYLVIGLGSGATFRVRKTLLIDERQ